ncbi:hypothetical protein GCM10009817_08030 [Terrabacter lapilli]|uniref:PH (Pleckstrin Homology) domain-containing protein n=1 Tax=Terrabacter lapilli TaxID=436231 RepID=A0ABN2RKG6_9MICO|nr:hypothetical protein [Terrabacter sp.]
MSAVHLNPSELTVELTPAEKVAGLHGDVTIPLAAVTAVDVVPDALAATHGLRAPGLSLPGVRKVGTWRTGNGSEFVVATRGQGGVRLTLTGHEFASVLLGDDDAEALATRIRTAR